MDDAAVTTVAAKSNFKNDDVAIYIVAVDLYFKHLLWVLELFPTFFFLL